MKIFEGFLLAILVVVVTFTEMIGAAAYQDEQVCYNQFQTTVSETLALRDTYNTKIAAIKRLQDSCESAVAVDCCQIKKLFPLAETGIYEMKDPCSSDRTFNSAKIYVRCDMETDGGGWIVIQRRIAQGTVNFYRNWEDYENGFGDLNTEFWIGLGNIYELTNNDEVDLIISVWNDIQTNITWRYPVFRIAGPTDKYRLTVSGGSGSGGSDGFDYNNGQYFTTYDRDNDNWGTNCGYILQGGWWYSRCTRSNLNGRHVASGLPGVSSDGQLLYWRSRNLPYTNSEMKIRNKSCGLS